MTTTPERDVSHEQKKLLKQDMDLAVCADPEDPRRGWRYHYPISIGEAMMGLASRAACVTCGESWLVNPR